jgi:hypothetical protein
MEMSGQLHAPAALLPEKSSHWLGVGPKMTWKLWGRDKCRLPSRNGTPIHGRPSPSLVTVATEVYQLLWIILTI